MKKEFEYKTCDKCCYDILDNEGDVMEHECLEPTPKEWEEFKKKLPQLLREGVIFGIFATTFLTGIAIALYHLLSHIKSF